MPYEAQATIMGHLGRDAETKTTGSGKQVTEFSVAVGRKEKDQKVTDWYKVTAWQLPDWKRDLLLKGALVLAIGELQLRTYEKRDGTQGSSVEVNARTVQVFDKQESPAPRQKQAEPPHAFAQKPMTQEELDQSVPF